MKYIIRKRIVNKHLVKNGFTFLNNDVKGDSKDGKDTQICRLVLCNVASIWKVKNGLIF